MVVSLNIYDLISQILSEKVLGWSVLVVKWRFLIKFYGKGNFIKINNFVMKVIYNNIIPFKGFIAANLFGVLFVRNEYKDNISNSIINHEEIHTQQMKELLYIGFYLWYIIEWFIKLIYYRNFYKAYRTISFEREAYKHQYNMYWILCRNKFHFLQYL